MRPTIEEVKEHFKDAEEVVSLYGRIITHLNDFHEFDNCYYAKDLKGGDRLIWDKEDGYATITKYKPNATPSTANHYGDRPDVIDFNTKYNLNFNLGSAVKYLARAGKKDGETKEKDLKKALDFITRELENNA